ncbi:hypothetical protein MHJ95_07220 [Corynebacterium imitans]|uniref:hypothetical protein n=1 Tax=Corynebacterium imitans TaxID=156978 RepID=UPI001EF374DE|nr:hypothetical protein [Corynebacterium imitans]MCG7278773.1 hypothetical protein [Corynebacterium imitans]
MKHKRSSSSEPYIPKTDVPPTSAQVAAARLIMKRDREGKGCVEITPKIHHLANYELESEADLPSSPPNVGQIAAAKLIMKRHREGKGRVEITPEIRYLASYED